MRTAVVVDRGLRSTVFSADTDGPRTCWRETATDVHRPQIKALFSAQPINLRSSGRMCPAEKQTMQLQVRTACATAVHVISALGVRKSSLFRRSFGGLDHRCYQGSSADMATLHSHSPVPSDLSLTLRTESPTRQVCAHDPAPGLGAARHRPSV